VCILHKSVYYLGSIYIDIYIYIYVNVNACIFIVYIYIYIYFNINTLYIYMFLYIYIHMDIGDNRMMAYAKPMRYAIIVAEKNTMYKFQGAPI